MKLGKKKEKEIVKAGTDNAEVAPPSPPDNLKVEQPKEIPKDVQETIKELQDKFTGIYNTPIDHSVVQRDELMSLTLAVLHEIKLTNKLLQEMLESE